MKLGVIDWEIVWLFLILWIASFNCSFVEATFRFLSFKFQVKIKRDTVEKWTHTCDVLSFPLAATLPYAPEHLWQANMGVSES